MTGKHAYQDPWQIPGIWNLGVRPQVRSHVNFDGALLLVCAASKLCLRSVTSLS